MIGLRTNFTQGVRQRRLFFLRISQLYFVQYTALVVGQRTVPYRGGCTLHNCISYCTLQGVVHCTTVEETVALMSAWQPPGMAAGRFECSKVATRLVLSIHTT